MLRSVVNAFAFTITLNSEGSAEQLIWSLSLGGGRDGQICCLPGLGTEAGSAQCKGQSSPDGSKSQGDASLSHILTKEIFPSLLQMSQEIS